MNPRELNVLPGGKDEFITDDELVDSNEPYVRMCIQIIMLCRSAHDLRVWFKEERELHFGKYGLSHRQIDRIIAACRDQVEILERRERKLA